MLHPFPSIIDIEQVVDHCQPNSMLCIGDDLRYLSNEGKENTISLGANYSEQREKILNPCERLSISGDTVISDSAFMQRYDLAIISTALEERSKVEGQQLLSRLRDLCSPRIIVMINFSACDWEPSDLLAFGLVRLHHYHVENDVDNSDETEATHYGVYHYNIDTYKQTPDWLNPKHWANPKLWDKVWW